MREIEINKTNLQKFINNIRKEDKDELIYYLKRYYKSKFIQIILKNTQDTYFLADKNTPVVIGGLSPIVSNNVKLGQVWLISTDKFSSHKQEIFKYINKKLSVYKKEYDILFNFIYKSNFSSLNWIKKIGFKVINTKYKDFKLFYMKKGGQHFDIRYITGQ